MRNKSFPFYVPRYKHTLFEMPKRLSSWLSVLLYTETLVGIVLGEHLKGFCHVLAVLFQFRYL
jgi:hypothetical protein